MRSSVRRKPGPRSREPAAAPVTAACGVGACEPRPRLPSASPSAKQRAPGREPRRCCGRPPPPGHPHPGTSPPTATATVTRPPGTAGAAVPHAAGHPLASSTAPCSLGCSGTARHNPAPAGIGRHDCPFRASPERPTGALPMISDFSPAITANLARARRLPRCVPAGSGLGPTAAAPRRSPDSRERPIIANIWTLPASAASSIGRAADS